MNKITVSRKKTGYVVVICEQGREERKESNKESEEEVEGKKDIRE